MVKESMTVSELSKDLGVSKQRIYGYINSATPDKYKYVRNRNVYIFSSEDVKLIKRINRLHESYTYRQIKRKLTIEMRDSGLIPSKDKRSEIIIPEFVANCIDEEEEKGTNLFKFIEKKLYKYHIGMIEYLESENLREIELEGRRELFTNAWINGYDGIETEKYYVVKAEGDNKFCLGKGSDGNVKLITDFDSNLFYHHYPLGALTALTEKEIKDFGLGFWSIAINSRR